MYLLKLTVGTTRLERIVVLDFVARAGSDQDLTYCKAVLICFAFACHTIAVGQEGRHCPML